MFNGYRGRFTVKFVNVGLNPGVKGVKTDNTVIDLTNDTTYDASEFTTLFKVAFASGYYANIVFL